MQRLKKVAYILILPIIVPVLALNLMIIAGKELNEKNTFCSKESTAKLFIFSQTELF